MRWFSAYLSERKQFVLFKGKPSELSELIKGVPQGSILGPLFFIVFMNDMPMSTRTISNVDMYADDCTISVCGKNVQEIELKLNNELQEISNWCDENRMVVNVEKNICTKGDKLQVVENERLHVDNVLTPGRPIYKIYTTQLPKNSHFCAG